MGSHDDHISDDHITDDHMTDDHGAGGGHVSIYGAILNVGSVRTSIVLICLFTFLTMLEYLLRAVQKFSERYKFDLLFVKLKQELMILGTAISDQLTHSTANRAIHPFRHNFLRVVHRGVQYRNTGLFLVGIV